MRNALASVALPLLVVVASACTKSVDSGSGNGSSEPAAPASAGAVEPAAAPAKVATPPFEGTLTMHIVAGKKEVELTVTTKPGKVRVDFPAVAGAKGQAEHTLFDSATKQTTVLSDARKTATTTGAVTATPAPFRSANKTGIHELIGGRDCEDWDAIDVTGRHETLCVAEGFDSLDINAMLPPDSGLPVFGSWLSDMRDQHQFPLRAVITDISGAIEAHWDLSRIDPHPVDDGMFTAPSGYSAH